MGRYAQFSTGFVYKFVFGVQPSTDIALYGVGFTDAEGGSCHEWNESDIPLLKEYLDEYAINWDLFPKSVEGTGTLLRAMRERKMPPDLSLVCVIYHQLLYCCPLSVDYEL